NRDLEQLATGLAALNVCAFCFALLEYKIGLTRFYPLSPVTEIMYSSQDVAGGFYRIPAIFTSAHAFGGTMVNSLPYLIGLWSYAQTKRLRLLALVGMAAGLVGILMSATRSNFLIGAVIISVAVVTTKMKTSYRIGFFTVLALVATLALTNERFQRFKSLGDADSVSERIGGSV